jgi:hypothetical protein
MFYFLLVFWTHALFHEYCYKTNQKEWTRKITCANLKLCESHLNKVREIKSHEFKASENEYTKQIFNYKGPYGIIFHSNEQCKIAIHFAEHINFGPFGHSFFVIVLFEPESKTLFRVLFSSLCLQIFTFYFGTYRNE